MPVGVLMCENGTGGDHDPTTIARNVAAGIRGKRTGCARGRQGQEGNRDEARQVQAQIESQLDSARYRAAFETGQRRRLAEVVEQILN